jgi:hypothetical protein
MTHVIVQKVWNSFTTLRDDGVGHGELSHRHDGSSEVVANADVSIEKRNARAIPTRSLGQQLAADRRVLLAVSADPADL